MTRLDITRATRLVYRRLNFRMVGRRGDQIDWTCDRTNESVTFTDEELAEMIGEGRAAFQAAGEPPRPATPEPEQMCEAELAAALRRFEYVEAIRAAGLAKRAKAETYAAIVGAVAKQRGEDPAPSSRSVKRWDAKAGDPPAVYRLIDEHSAKGNRTDRTTELQRALIPSIAWNSTTPAPTSSW